MTRVEKYREYRKEILNSFYNEKKVTKKSILSERVSNATLNTDTGNSLSYDDVLEAYELYEEKKEEPAKKTLSKVQKKQLLFLIIGILVVVALLVGLIIVGINVFGGNQNA